MNHSLTVNKSYVSFKALHVHRVSNETILKINLQVIKNLKHGYIYYIVNNTCITRAIKKNKYPKISDKIYIIIPNIS